MMITTCVEYEIFNTIVFVRVRCSFELVNINATLTAEKSWCNLEAQLISDSIHSLLAIPIRGLCLLLLERKCFLFPCIQRRDSLILILETRASTFWV